MNLVHNERDEFQVFFLYLKVGLLDIIYIKGR